jgi:hypothetical protein
MPAKLLMLLERQEQRLRVCVMKSVSTLIWSSPVRRLEKHKLGGDSRQDD